MLKRGYKPNEKLIRKALNKRHNKLISAIIEQKGINLACNDKILPNRIYLEHNDKYYKECIENLKQKGINI